MHLDDCGSIELPPLLPLLFCAHYGSSLFNHLLQHVQLSSGVHMAHHFRGFSIVAHDRRWLRYRLFFFMVLQIREDRGTIVT